MILSQLPQYQDLPAPEFSAGWLVNFKLGIESNIYTRHDEAGPVGIAAVEATKPLKTLAGDYKEEDIYNIDDWSVLENDALQRSFYAV